MKYFPLAIFLALAGMTPVAYATDDDATRLVNATADTPLSEGEIRKVEKAAGKLTIKHGPLENLGMPAMTMVFRVKDASTLDQVKPGDHVRFLAERLDGVLTVVRIEVVRP